MPRANTLLRCLIGGGATGELPHFALMLSPPWHDRWAEMVPFHDKPPLRGGKVTTHAAGSLWMTCQISPPLTPRLSPLFFCAAAFERGDRLGIPKPPPPGGGHAPLGRALSRERQGHWDVHTDPGSQESGTRGPPRVSAPPVSAVQRTTR